MAEQIAELEQRIVELLESKKSFARVVERMGARSKLIESQLEALQEEQAAVLPEDCSLADWAKAWRERTADFEAQLDCHEEMLASAWTAIGSREEGQFLDEAICQLVAARDCQATRIAELEADRDRLRAALANARNGIKNCYGGMGPASTIWGNTQYDKAYANAITAALSAFDLATAALSAAGEHSDKCPTCKSEKQLCRRVVREGPNKFHPCRDEWHSMPPDLSVEHEHPDTAKLRAVMEWLDERERAYPKNVDIFRPLSAMEQIRVNIAVSDLGVVRDRLSADISRLWCQQLRAAIESATEEADRG